MTRWAPANDGLSARACMTRASLQVSFLDEGEFPGGVQQKGRLMRPMVDELLLGYDPAFVGFVEVPEDGVGEVVRSRALLVLRDWNPMVGLGGDKCVLHQVSGPGDGETRLPSPT